MEKPISLKIKEFKNEAVNLVNKSGLPLIVVESILKDILGAVQTKLDQEYLRDKETYDKYLTNELEKIEKEEQGDNEND